MADLHVIELTDSGEGSYTVDLGDALVILTTRFNYAAGAWTMDVQDIDGNMLVAGLMLVPNIDVLLPYTELKELLGGLVLIELNADDYRSDILLGQNTKLLWFPVGTEVEIPA